MVEGNTWGGYARQSNLARAENLDIAQNTVNYYYLLLFSVDFIYIPLNVQHKRAVNPLKTKLVLVQCTHSNEQHSNIIY
jgi:hypothetical protein